MSAAVIERTLRTFVVPGRVVTIQALYGPRKARSVCTADIPTAVQTALEMEAENPLGVYFGLNPVQPDFAGGVAFPKNAHISERLWLGIDVDPCRPSGTSSTETETAAAWAVLDRCLSTLPDLRNPVIGLSGNGWQAAHPILLPNDEASQGLVATVLRILATRCGDQVTKEEMQEMTATGQPLPVPKATVGKECHDAKRIWCLYGTTKRKGTPTVERPHRRTFLHGGEPWNQVDALENVRLLREFVAAAQYADDLHKNRPTGDLLSRARAYIAKEPPAISGQHGHDRTFHVACVLVKDFGLAQDLAYQAIQEWNRTCVPPWSEKELRHKLADAARKEGPVGRLAGEQPAQTEQVQSQTECPAPEQITADDVATIDDLIAAGAEIRWLWPGWIQTGVLTAIAAPAGTGKTRFCADLVRRIRHGLTWPDGQTILTPQDAIALWVVADNHHDEMVTLAADFNIKDNIRINASKKEPYGGTTLDEVADLRALAARVAAVRPVMVIVDTVGGATDKNMTKQEDAKAFYGPLQTIARQYNTAVLCITHLNATGQFLGRRILERVRVALKMDTPDPGDERRRLVVHKSNSKKASGLGVTMTDHGNDYDNSPPTDPEEGGGRGGSCGEDGPAISAQCQKAMDWLAEYLKDGPKRVSNTRSEGEFQGFSSRTIYKAMRHLKVEEYESEGRKWWRLLAEGEVAE